MIDMVTIFKWFVILVGLLLVLAFLYRMIYKIWNWFRETRTGPKNKY